PSRDGGDRRLDHPAAERHQVSGEAAVALLGDCRRLHPVRGASVDGAALERPHRSLRRAGDPLHGRRAVRRGGGPVRRAGALQRDPSILRRLCLIPGLALMLFIAAPWFVEVSLANPEFPGFFVVHEHLQRFLTAVHRRDEPLLFFVPFLLGGLFPWTVTMID